MPGPLLHARSVLASTLLPSLRVVGLTYTGLLGMLAAMLIAGIALMPVTPAIQQVAEPARQAVTNLIQPPSDAVVSLFGGPAVRVAPLPPLSAPVTIDLTISEQLPTDEPGLGQGDEPFDAPPASTLVGLPPRAPVLAVQVAPVANAPVPMEVVEVGRAAADASLAIEGDRPIALAPALRPTPTPTEKPVVVLPAEPPALQIASQEEPKELPTLVPTETPQQQRTRLNAVNQAAIDAAKAAQVRARAEADAANQAAIDALKTGSVAATLVVPPAPLTPLSVPTASPSASAPSALPPASGPALATSVPVAAATTVRSSKAAVDAGNQAAIDAAKAAKAHPNATVQAVDRR